MWVEDDEQRVLVVTSVRNTERKDGTYNLTVADFHTYFVGEFNVLVHNCGINMKGTGGAERTSGSPAELKQQVANLKNDKAELSCAQCKLKTSIKNRRTEQKRHNRNTKTYKDHNNRIKLEEKELNKVDNRLKELEKKE